MSGSNSDSSRDKFFGLLLMFVIGFAGFAILSAVILVILVSFGFLPVI